MSGRTVKVDIKLWLDKLQLAAKSPEQETLAKFIRSNDHILLAFLGSNRNLTEDLIRKLFRRAHSKLMASKKQGGNEETTPQKEIILILLSIARHDRTPEDVMKKLKTLDHSHINITLLGIQHLRNEKIAKRPNVGAQYLN